MLKQLVKIWELLTNALPKGQESALRSPDGPSLAVYQNTGLPESCDGGSQRKGWCTVSPLR